MARSARCPTSAPSSPGVPAARARSRSSSSTRMRPTSCASGSGWSGSATARSPCAPTRGGRPGSGSTSDGACLESTRAPGLRGGRALAAVQVLDPHHVVEVRRRDLEDQGVLDGGDAMHCPRPVAERVAGLDLDRLELAADLAQLERCTSLADEPRLVLHLVVLEAQRLARPDEQQLADVVVGLRPDELPAPGLLDVPRLDRVPALHPSHLGFAATYSSARRSSFGVLTVSQRPVCRYARSFPSAASSGNVVVSWSPFSGNRSTASAERT